MTLVVEVDGEPRVFAPHVRVCGPASFAGGTLRVALVDERGSVRHADRCELSPGALGTDLPIPPFGTPPGAELDEVLAWCWEIAVEADSLELIRWHRYLAASTRLTAEAEIDFAGPRADLPSKVEDEGRGPESPWDRRDSMRLLVQLTEEGVLTADDEARILVERIVTGKTAERLLIERGFVGEREVLLRWAELTGSEFVELADYPIDPDAAARIPDDVARHHGAIGIGFRGSLLTVAMSDPQKEPWEVADLYAATGAPIYTVVATRDDVLAALDRRRLIFEPSAR